MKNANENENDTHEFALALALEGSPMALQRVLRALNRGESAGAVHRTLGLAYVVVVGNGEAGRGGVKGVKWRRRGTRCG